MANKYLVVIVGPTAIGKTSLSIEIAQHFQTEIVSADSRQFFREMSIGTAKPSTEELTAVPHHFIDNLSIEDSYTAGKYEHEVLEKLEELFEKNSFVVMTGGSGLYIKAVCEGFDDQPAVDESIRDKLIQTFENEGFESLQQQLKELDPKYYEQVDLQNSQRVIRALEICLGTGKPFSSFRKNEIAQRPFEIIKIGLEMDREALYDRINLRVDQMMEAGLLDEVRELLPHQHLNALQTVGYQELFDHLNGEISQERAVELIKRNTRRYAKRQMTWNRKDVDIKWFKPTDKEGIIRYLSDKTSAS